MAAEQLAISSLREALEAAMEEEPHAAVRDVTVRAVHVGQAAALLAFLRYKQRHRRWNLLNASRLAELVHQDNIIRALAYGLVPLLVENPPSRSALDLLHRYARHLKGSASKVGGTFQPNIIRLSDALVQHTKLQAGADELLGRTHKMGERLRGLRATQLTISDKRDDPDAEDSASDDDDEEVLAFDYTITTLREALLAVADDTGAVRRVTVSGVKPSDSAPLLAVLRLQSARGWAVRGLGPLATVTSVDACCHAVEAGFLHIISDNPTSAAALALLDGFAGYIKQQAATVDGGLPKDTITIGNLFIRHAKAASRMTAAETAKSTHDLRRSIGIFRNTSVSITSGSDVSASASASTSASEY